MSFPDRLWWLMAFLVILCAFCGVAGWLTERKLDRERDRLLPPPCRSTERAGSQAEFRRRMAARRWMA
jgi:hypothetical protein